MGAVKCSHSAPISEEDKHCTTFATEWGRYRYTIAPQEYGSYVTRNEDITAAIERTAQTSEATVMWDADQDLEAHWRRVFDYLVILGKHGMFVDRNEFQFCERTVNFAGLRVSDQKLEPLPAYREAIMAIPTPANTSEAHSWCSFVNQLAQYVQLQPTGHNGTL